MDQEQSINYAKKQYNVLRLIAVFVVGIFLITTVCAVCLIPRANRIMEQAEEVLGDLASVTEELEEADLPGLIKNLDGLIVESGDGIREAMESLGAVDIESLNEAIGDLKAIVEPLGRLFGR